MTRRGLLLGVLLVLSGAGSVEARHLPLVGDTVTVANRTQTLPEVFGSLHHTPDRPSGLTATRGIGQVRLGWEAADDDGIGAGSTGRGWARRRGGGWKSMAGSGASTTSHTVDSLRTGTEHRFRVRAYTRGYGAASDSASATPDVLLADAYNGGVLLRWMDPARADVGRAGIIIGWNYRVREARARGATGGRPAMRARGRTRCRG